MRTPNLYSLQASINALTQQVAKMSLDLTKLQAAIPVLQAAVTKLQTDVPAAITAAAAGADDATNQAAIDSVTQTLGVVSNALTALDTSIVPPATAPAAPAPAAA
jgi:hypothetical protein